MKRLFADLLITAARAAGYEVIPRWRLDRLALATHLQELFTRLAVDCVLDVGANRGQYARFLRRNVGYTGSIVSFEPQPACLPILAAAASRDPRWEIRSYALGSQNGELPLNVMSDSAFTSFLLPDHSAVPALAHLNTVDRVQVVRVKRLDDAMAEMGGASGYRSIYLKLDTQGYDPEVIKGAGATLVSVAALQTEISVLPIYGGMTDWLTALRALKELSFDVTGLFPVSRDPNLKVVEFDCVAVNTAFRGRKAPQPAPSRAARPATHQNAAR